MREAEARAVRPGQSARGATQYRWRQDPPWHLLPGVSGTTARTISPLNPTATLFHRTIFEKFALAAQFLRSLPMLTSHEKLTLLTPEPPVPNSIAFSPNGNSVCHQLRDEVPTVPSRTVTFFSTHGGQGGKSVRDRSQRLTCVRAHVRVHLGSIDFKVLLLTDRVRGGDGCMLHHGKQSLPRQEDD
jgi:hypothetical protein